MIREATTDDLDALVYLENSSFETDKISRRNFRYLLNRANASTFVDEDSGKIRAYSIILYNSATSHARLYSIVVGSEYRGLGIGQALLAASEKDAILNECISMRLEVRRDNSTAIHLYEKNGYKQIGILDDYYEDHMGAIHFEKEIVPLYYERNSEKIPVDWLEMVKESLRTLTPRFSLRRMLKEYTTDYYLPAIQEVKPGK